MDADQVVVDDGGWNEPTMRPATIVRADPVQLADALSSRLPEPGSATWLEEWLAADRAADRALRTWLAGLRESFEAAAIPETAAALSDGSVLFIGSSMPVRDLDAYLPGGSSAIRCIGNRGANGIDGVVSSALGAAAAGEGPVVLIVGDVSFLHDLNALIAARLNRISATIVLLNNDGGGIFSFLPQAETDRVEVGLPERFEALFGTPHGIDVGPIVMALGGEHRRIGAGELTGAVAASLGRPGVRVLELRTDRTRNVELHRAAIAAAVVAIDASINGRPR
jgi:2-succinyl-5-enolpyruvyl-6-hydroxy-3-cyclohexene-1-carboxylate synthase